MARNAGRCTSPGDPAGRRAKYIQQATAGPDGKTVPIYVDPNGLQEAEKTMTSPIQLDLEGVPLKTTLRLILRQLGLMYQVQDGMLIIRPESTATHSTTVGRSTTPATSSGVAFWPGLHADSGACWPRSSRSHGGPTPPPPCIIRVTHLTPLDENRSSPM